MTRLVDPSSVDLPDELSWQPAGSPANPPRHWSVATSHSKLELASLLADGWEPIGAFVQATKHGDVVGMVLRRQVVAK